MAQSWRKLESCFQDVEHDQKQSAETRRLANDICNFDSCGGSNLMQQAAKGSIEHEEVNGPRIDPGSCLHTYCRRLILIFRDGQYAIDHMEPFCK